MVFWIVVAAVIALATALAWWSSGRARRLAPSARVRNENEHRAMKEYRPPTAPGGTPPGG